MNEDGKLTLTVDYKKKDQTTVATAYVRTVLGQTVAETVLTSDNATIAAPAGVVFVTVGNETVKVAVK